MRLIWGVKYDGYDDDYDFCGEDMRIVGLHEGLSDWIEARWWTLRHLLQRRTPKREFLGTTTKVVDMNDAITMLDPDTSAFQTMLMKLARKGQLEATKVYWLEDELMPRVGSIVLWGEWDWIEA